MHSTLSLLVKRLKDPELINSEVIPWSSPVPSFGDLSKSKVATLGLNPSNREFVDIEGKELINGSRRFHTLNSLGLSRWEEAEPQHLDMIIESCDKYFKTNPYDGWFKSLDNIISGSKASYYNDEINACHLDLIPYATSCKWTDLSSKQRTTLLSMGGDTLGLLLRDSPVQLLILNGKSVVENLQRISETSFDITEISDWLLPRKSGRGVKGYAYTGVIKKISGVDLNREISVLGYNHNIQSSFGVTQGVKGAIRNWVSESARELLDEGTG